MPDPRLPYRELDADFLAPRDPLLGYIKVGGRSPDVRYARGTGRPWVAPIRLLNPARFEVTTREKRTKKMKGKGNASGQDFTVDLGYVRDEEFHGLEDVGAAPSRLRIRLLYPTWKQNLIAFLGAYGREWVCRGNGVEAIDIKRGECACPCPRLTQFDGEYSGTKPNDSIQCKPHGQLNVLLEDAGVFGGFWALKTTSYGTISNLIKSLQMFEEMFGRVDGLPLELRVMAVTMQVPGGGTTVQPQVTLVLPASMDGARQLAKAAATESRKYLPAGGELDETKYLAAVVEEMEAEVESYASEFMPPGEVLEVEEEAHDPALPGEVESREEFRRDLDKAEGVVEGELRKQAGIQAGQRAAEAILEAARAQMAEAEDNLVKELEKRLAKGLPVVSALSGDGPSVQAGAPQRGEPEVQDATSPPDEVEEPTREEDPDPEEPGDSGKNPEPTGKDPDSSADSDRNDDLAEYDRANYELAKKLLESTGDWTEEGIQDRLEYHRKTGTLDTCVQRLKKHMPDAWAKVAAENMDTPRPSPS